MKKRSPVCEQKAPVSGYRVNNLRTALARCPQKTYKTRDHRNTGTPFKVYHNIKRKRYSDVTEIRQLPTWCANDDLCSCSCEECVPEPEKFKIQVEKWNCPAFCSQKRLSQPSYDFCKSPQLLDDVPRRDQCRAVYTCCVDNSDSTIESERADKDQRSKFMSSRREKVKFICRPNYESPVCSSICSDCEQSLKSTGKSTFYKCISPPPAKVYEIPQTHPLGDGTKTTLYLYSSPSCFTHESPTDTSSSSTCIIVRNSDSLKDGTRNRPGCGHRSAEVVCFEDSSGHKNPRMHSQSSGGAHFPNTYSNYHWNTLGGALLELTVLVLQYVTLIVVSVAAIVGLMIYINCNILAHMSILMTILLLLFILMVQPTDLLIYSFLKNFV